jgi:hypothetical protein
MGKKPWSFKFKFSLFVGLDAVTVRSVLAIIAKRFQTERLRITRMLTDLNRFNYCFHTFTGYTNFVS